MTSDELSITDLITAMWLSVIFFFKQETAYVMRISDWSSDVCSSDLHGVVLHVVHRRRLTVDLGLPQQRDDVVLRIDAAVFKRVLDAVEDAPQPLDAVERIRRQIGRASCRERVCQYV